MNRSTQRKILLLFVSTIILVVIGLLIKGIKHNTPSEATIQVVAAENFWGSLASQIGGKYVHVTSIVSDPNADPHEYESSTVNARAIAGAQYVIINGAGYDSWANKLLNAEPSNRRTVLSVASLLGKKEGDNPHFWYDPTYVRTVTVQIEQDLERIAPERAHYFKQQYHILSLQLATYEHTIATIHARFAGTKVAATEDIFQYLANATELNLISPPPFIQAVAEGNDPPTNSVTLFEQQLASGQVHVLVYNKQTVTPLTESMKELATAQHIPMIGITETIQPPNTPLQQWMNTELMDLDKALNTSTQHS